MDIRSYIAGAGLSQAKFADLLGVHPITLSKWINGKSLPSRENIATIERITGGKVTAAELRPDFAALFVSAHRVPNSSSLATHANGESVSQQLTEVNPLAGRVSP